MKLSLSEKQKLSQKEPQDLVDEIIQELATECILADSLAKHLQLIISRVKPKFDQQKQIFNDALLALEAYNQHKSKEPK